MEHENNYSRKRKVSRQSWNPGPWLTVLSGVWKGVYSVLKIALGALATVLFIVVVCAVIFIGVLADYLEGEIVPQAGIQLEGFDLNQNSYLYYVDSSGNIQELQKLYADAKSEWASWDEIPEDLVYAAVSIEDHRFFEHQGVDWFTTIKACVNMFIGSGDQFGGSSITQQLVKNIYLQNEDESADDVTVQRKVLEIFRATELEKRYDKSVIMEWYLNYIYLGNRIYGVKEAASYYFGKELEYLTTAECASLISITNNPSIFRLDGTKLIKYKGEEHTGYEWNMIRKENTLWLMRNYGYLTEEEYQEALVQELVLKNGIDLEDKAADCVECGYHDQVKTFTLGNDGVYYCPQCGVATSIGDDASQEVYSWFVETVLEDVAMEMAENSGLTWSKETRDTLMNLICRGGYHIYTTLDMDAQNAVDTIYQDLDQIPNTNSVQQLQSGIVVIDNVTGDIVALSGGVGNDKGFDDYNRATEAKLQPGSSIKPLSVYAPAFELGLISPASVGTDMPLYYSELSGSTEENPLLNPWPKNDNRKYNYRRSILSAVRSSVNAIAVNTLNTMGVDYSFNFAKEKFGLYNLVETYTHSNGTVSSDIDLAPLGMGAPTVGVTVRQMANAFATFANDGVWREARTWTKVYNNNGEVVLSNDQESRAILTEKTINYMNYCLDEAVGSGTGAAADISGQNVAGKTGTTSSNKDRWFCGFTGYYTAAVWCGYDTPETINLGTNPAAQLFKKVLTPLHKGKTAIKLYDDSEFVKVAICLDSGKLATDACLNDCRESRVFYGDCYAEDIPTQTCDKHVNVTYCSSGTGAANIYCEYFAAAGQCTLSQKALVKLTVEEVEDIRLACKHGLASLYNSDLYIYLVNNYGSALSFHGMNGDANVGVDAPYIVCTEHTKEAWEAYLAQIGSSDQPSIEPTDEPVDEETEE